MYVDPHGMQKAMQQLHCREEGVGGLDTSRVRLKQTEKKVPKFSIQNLIIKTTKIQSFLTVYQIFSPGLFHL